jgi:uncharacterized FlaG/YvyC family protein
MELVGLCPLMLMVEVMKKIKVYVATRFVRSQDSLIIEVEDDATEEEINQAALEAMFEMIEWGYEEIS